MQQARSCVFKNHRHVPDPDEVQLSHLKQIFLNSSVQAICDYCHQPSLSSRDWTSNSWPLCELSVLGLSSLTIEPTAWVSDRIATVGRSDCVYVCRGIRRWARHGQGILCCQSGLGAQGHNLHW